MTDPKPNEVERELAYYKRQTDSLAGENLRMEYILTGLRHELKQKREGFALLSQMQESIGAHKELSSIFAVALPGIGAVLGMDKAVVLTPSRAENAFRPTQWIGFRQEATAGFDALEIVFPPEIVSGVDRMLVGKATARTPLIEQIQTAFELPYFVSVPVVVEGQVVGLIISGRLREAKPLYPALDQGDLDTFVAIAGLISASVRIMRVGVLEEMDRLKTEFFANISHEFRTPITLTVGPVEQILGGRYGQITDGAREQLEIVRRNQQRLLTLVNQILDLAKLEAGEMKLRVAATPNANRFLTEMAGPFATAAEQRGLELRLSLSPACDSADLYIDREKVERMLWNLLSNALKFTRRGHIEIATGMQGETFRLSVSDTGIGIKEDQLPHIFDRFRQADGSESREFAGTGIGLSLVQEIARLHGGSVTVRNRYGSGTTFQVTLPLGRQHLPADAIVVPPSEPLPTRHIASELAFATEGRAEVEGVETENENAEKTFDVSRPTILYAEDHPDLRHHVRRLLAIHYNVFLAVDGRDALEKMRRYKPDLVVSDQMMPNMSGRELLRAIRDDEALRATPVVFLTARAGTEARIESLDAGADDYLTKPFNEGELLARVRNLLQARAQERELDALNRRLEARVDAQVAELVRGGELQRFLPRAVAERVLAGQLGGKDDFARRKLTVLCAEIAGLAELTEELEPEELSATMNEFFRETAAVAAAHAGTVNRLMTDGVMILFGAPEEMPLPDQARHAIQTGIELRDRVRELTAIWRRRGISGALSVRAGIHTGYCTVGVFGSDLLRSYTAIGTPVTMAMLFQEDAAPGSIICGLPTRALLDGHVQVTDRGARPLRGISRPVESFELADDTGRTASGHPIPRLHDYSFIPR
jgi:signal transduction histidine kinase/class 3 adenylate cyclase